tara:strand:- start:34 stop:642 length:609 start_codon:yes stop_codon:yes gene_type:complete
MKIMLASKNEGKILEIQDILKNLPVKLISHRDLEIPEVDETGTSFVENAILKARSASITSGLPSIADDSGIEVDFLNAKPGVKSARFSGDNATNQENNIKLLKELDGVPFENRRACYRCVIVFMRFPDDPFPIISTGSWQGYIAEKSIGDNGFGYDPIFFLSEFKKTSAQLNKDHKNQISHRAKALKGIENYFANQHNYDHG